MIPGIEITTADGDLLALFISEKVDAGLSLVETVLRVRELGRMCIAPHPMAGGMGMKSLSAKTILKALRDPQVAETLIGIETYSMRPGQDQQSLRQHPGKSVGYCPCGKQRCACCGRDRPGRN